MLKLFIVLSYLVGIFYVYRAVRNITKNSYLSILYWVFTFAGLLYFIIKIIFNTDSIWYNPQKTVPFFSFFALYLSIASTSFLLFMEDLFRFASLPFRKKKNKKIALSSRRRFVSQLALGIGAFPFGSLIYGIYGGRYHFQTIAHQLFFDDLPEAFEEYKIVHVSDFHCGGLDNQEKVEYAINLIKKQDADVILFTGDFIDVRAEEIYKWRELFSSLNAKDGKFSILGNHDYGDYARWDTEGEKEENFKLHKKLQKEMGFQLLLNANHFIEKEGQRLALIGVEHWDGDKFKKADLKKASKGVDSRDFKILMTHNPDHWRYKALNSGQYFHLTLSGHTHGTQFGLEIPGKFQWTPVRTSFKYWAGLYKEFGQYINVNRGFGYTFFPARLGIWPEISVITLKKK